MKSLRRTVQVGKLVVAALLAWGVVSPAHGAELMTDRVGYVGGLLGLSSVSDNIGTGVGYGVQAGYFFHENWGVGAFLRGGNHSNGITSFFFGGEALYRLANVLPGLHLGAILGSGKFSAGGFSGNNSFTYGLKAAYDYLISNNYPISLGVDLSVQWIEPVNTNFTVFSPLVTAKFWF